MKAKNFTAMQYTLLTISPVRKDSQLLYIIFEHRFPNLVVVSLLMPLLTLQDTTYLKIQQKGEIL